MANFWENLFAPENIGALIGGGIGMFGGPAMAGLGATAGYGIGGMFDGNDYGDEYEWAMPPAPEFYPRPEYPETAGARQTWWDRLQQYGKDPYYGAISPDWGDIWERAKKRVSQSYWGGAGGQPGLAAKVKASAARRNVSESPALETELTRMGMQEAGQLGDIATEQAIQEAAFGETGRQSWLQNIARIAGLQMPGMWQTAMGYIPTQDTTWGDLASAAGTYFGQTQARKQQQDWWKKMIEEYGGYKKQTEMPTSIIGGGGTWGDLYSEWMK